MEALMNAAATAAALPYPALVDEIEALLGDADVQVPERLVQPLPGGGSLFVMPALDAHVAMTKLISFTPANAAPDAALTAAGVRRPTIQGDVVVFDIASGERRLVLDGPTVTARRTAAVSALAARRLAPRPDGPLLVVGAGVQGRSHLEAFAQCLGVAEVWIASRTPAGAEPLAAHARALGLRARVVVDADAALAECPLAVTCTPASGVVLHGPLSAGGFLAAVGAFTPRMVELAPALCRHAAGNGRLVVDTPHAGHEAGDLLQAGLDPATFPSLADVLRTPSPAGTGPVLFKSCGWAGWDLAAARLAVRQAHGAA